MEGGVAVVVVGATGAVGREFLVVLDALAFPIRSLLLLASKRSAGTTIPFRGHTHVVHELTANSFDGLGPRALALFSAGSAVSKEYAPLATAAGCLVVDNSSFFRMDPSVPLVVPEINAEALRAHKGIVANPNCTTAITLMALAPLHRRFGCRRVFASSYQAVSGTGAQAIEELREQVARLSQERPIEPPRVYKYQIAFNVIPQVDVMLDDGYTKEEAKLVNEGRKILGHPDFRASITCVRVPVYRAHSVAVSAEFERPVSITEAEAVLREMSGLDYFAQGYPMPLERAGKHNVAVGRLRLDSALDNGLAFFVCGDQILKGAALNAVQIAATMIDMKLL